jgi:hypothetical protein
VLEQTEEWRKLYTDKLHDLHSTLNIYMVIKSRRIKRVGFIGENSNVCRVLREANLCSMEFDSWFFSVVYHELH